MAHGWFQHGRACRASGVRQSALWLAALAALVVPVVAHSESLLEAYVLAHDNDPKYRAAQADARANGTALDQARAGFLPTARFEFEKITTGQKILSSNNPVFAAGETTFPTSSQTLSITQPIFRKDVMERYTQAKAVVRQAEFTVLAAEQDLLLRTSAAYLSILAATDSLALAQAERETVGKALDLAREKLQAGLGTITSQYEAAARFGVTQAREIEAQNKLRDAKQGLREITAKVIDSYATLREEFTLASPEPLSVQAWVDTALEQNLSLKARREALEVARQDVKRQSAGHWPSLNLVISNNRRDAGSTLFGGGSNVETTDMSLKLTVPLYEGGLTSAVTREAAFRVERSREDLELETRAVERATRAAYDGALSGMSLVRALKQSVISQASALEAKDVGQKAGRFTSLAVLDAERDLFLAKRDYAQARYDYLLNFLKLKQAAGTLSEADLASIHAALL